MEAGDDGGITSTSSSGVSSEDKEMEASRVTSGGALQQEQPPRRWHARVAQKVERWLFLYNVTTGLYMLDWWERCIVNAIFALFFALVGNYSVPYLHRVGAGLLAWAWWGNSSPTDSSLAAADETGFG